MRHMIRKGRTIVAKGMQLGHPRKPAMQERDFKGWAGEPACKQITLLRNPTSVVPSRSDLANQCAHSLSNS